MHTADSAEVSFFSYGSSAACKVEKRWQNTFPIFLICVQISKTIR